MYLVLTLLIVFLSWIGEAYGYKVEHPQHGEWLRVQSLLSPEGIRWWLRHSIQNFTNFAPVGMSVMALFGLGVAQHAGFVEACIRGGIRRTIDQRLVVMGTIVLGLLSNALGDGGYILLLPLAAWVFKWVGLPPMAGLLTAYVSVAGGYSANVLLSTVDPLLAHITQETLLAVKEQPHNVGALANYYFMAASTLLLAGVIYLLTKRFLLHQFPTEATQPSPEVMPADSPLSKTERRGIKIALLVGLAYVAGIVALTFFPFGVLSSVNGGLMHSPFTAGILFLLALGIGLMGLAYGVSTGRYRSDSDVMEGLMHHIKQCSIYFVIVFFAAQMFACLDFSHLDRYLVVVCARALEGVCLHPTLALLGFVVGVGVANLLMVSATAKWQLLAPIFLPLFASMGVGAEVVQAAFRVGDSVTNTISPCLFYMPLVLTYMLQYDKQASYDFLLKHTWRYALCCGLAWVALLLLWYVAGIPMGL